MALILVVEDDPVTAVCTLRCLARMGHQTIGPVASAWEAIHQAEVSRPDLVVMDIELDGETDGITAAREIFVRFGIASIYLTSQNDEVTRARAYATAPLGYLLKPASASLLQATLDSALQQSA